MAFYGDRIHGINGHFTIVRSHLDQGGPPSAEWQSGSGEGDHPIFSVNHDIQIHQARQFPAKPEKPL